jgi:hypothetical protein
MANAEDERRAPWDPAHVYPYPEQPDVPEPHVEAPGVRPYLLTGGRVRPADGSLEIEAQVLTTPAGRADAEQLMFEHRDIVALCERPLAIAEIAARLGLHLSVARVLASDLITAGYLAVRRPDAGLHQDAQIIERVIRGLQAIR